MSEVIERKFFDPDQEYVQVRVPDKMRIAELLTSAKGERTMAQLAEACGVSASTLSRAVNGKITKPLTVELIKSITQNSSNKEEAFFEQLMRANGMLPKDRAAHLESSPHRNMEQRREYEIVAKNIISSELIKRGIPFRFVTRAFEKAGKKSDYSLRWTSTFAIEIEDRDRRYLWNFLVFPYEFDPDERKMPASFLLQRLMDNVSGWFLTDAWEPEKFEGIKNTIVFIDSVFYDLYIDNVLGAKMNGDFSILLVDREKEIVANEIAMIRKTGDERESIFTKPVIDDDGDNDDPWDRPELL